MSGSPRVLATWGPENKVMSQVEMERALPWWLPDERRNATGSGLEPGSLAVTAVKATTVIVEIPHRTE
ncbi:MAG: hypothetical protein WAX29_02410 [Propionibacterium sp.]